jgi:serine/threonine kinase 16
MKLLDSAVVQEMDGKTVYLFLPYQPMGNVQDYINKGLVLGRRWAEKSLLGVFLGACYGVKELHCYKLKDVGVRRVDGEERGKGQMARSDGMFVKSEEEEEEGLILRGETPGGDKAPLIDSSHTGGDGGEEEDDDVEGDEEGGESSYPPRKKRNEFEQRQPRPSGNDLQGAKGGELVPYAHRDIKPGNIMLSPVSTQDGEAALHPVLMDFGSTCRARLHITSRREAIAEQDVAAERSSMAYRAPEVSRS